MNQTNESKAPQPTFNLLMNVGKYVKRINQGDLEYQIMDRGNVKFLQNHGIKLEDNCILQSKCQQQKLNQDLYNQILQEIVKQSYKVIQLAICYDEVQFTEILNSINFNQNLSKLEFEVIYAEQEFQKATEDILNAFVKLSKNYCDWPTLHLLNCNSGLYQLFIQSDFSSFFLNIKLENNLNSANIDCISDLFQIHDRFIFKKISIILLGVSCLKKIFGKLIAFISQSQHELEILNLEFSQLDEQSLLELYQLLNYSNKINISQQQQHNLFTDIISNNFNLPRLNLNYLNIVNGFSKILLMQEENVENSLNIISQLINLKNDVKPIQIVGKSGLLEKFILGLSKNIMKRVKFEILIKEYQFNMGSLCKAFISKNIFKYQLIMDMYLFEQFDQQCCKLQENYQAEITREIMNLIILQSQLQYYLYQKSNHLILDFIIC